MKKFYILIILNILLALSCSREEIEIQPYGEIPELLKINSNQGIRLEKYIVKEDVLINLKSPEYGTSRIRIKDIQEKTISQEKLDLIKGNNILKIHVKALPKDSYTIEVVDKTGNLIGRDIFSLIK